MKKIVSIILQLSIFVLFSCKQSDENPIPDQQADIVTVHKSEYKHYEICVINYKQNLPYGTLISAKVGEKDTKIGVASDSTLAFTVVPQIYNLGKNTIIFSVDDKQINLDIQVIASVSVADPDQSFHEFITTQNTQLDDLAGLINSNSTFQNSTEVNDALTKSYAILNELKVSFNNMSTDDKTLIANFLFSNKAIFDEVNNNLNSSLAYPLENNSAMRVTQLCATGTPVEKYKCHWIFLKDNLLDAAYWGGLATIAALTIPVTNLAGLGVSACAAALAAPSLVKVVMISAKLVVIHFKIAYLLVFDQPTESNLKVAADEIEFINNISIPLPVSLSIRNVQSLDGGSQLSWLKLGMAAITKYNAMCDKISIPQCKFYFGNQSEISTSPYSLDYMKVSNISNPNVKLGAIGGTNQAPTISFTTQAALDQNFTFDITYNDGVNLPVTARMKGLLIANPPTLSITSATVVDNTVMPGETGERVHNSTINLRVNYIGPDPTQIAVLTNNSASVQTSDWKSISASNGILNYTFNTDFASMYSRGLWKLRIYIKQGEIVSSEFIKNVTYTTLINYTVTQELDYNNMTGTTIVCPSELIGSTQARTLFYYNPTEGGINCGEFASQSELKISETDSYLVNGLSAAGYSNFTYYDANGATIASLSPAAFMFYVRDCGVTNEPSPYTEVKYVEVAYSSY